MSVSDQRVYIKLKNLNEKKATGYDMVPPPLVKMAAKVLSRPVANLVSESPRSLKSFLTRNVHLRYNVERGGEQGQQSNVGEIMFHF